MPRKSGGKSGGKHGSGPMGVISHTGGDSRGVGADMGRSGRKSSRNGGRG